MAGLGLIILTFICTDTAGAAVRPVVSFSPNWTPIFPGESVTLSCNVAPTAQGNLGYSWYRDGERIRRDEQNLTGVTDSGDYQCQAGASERSDPVTLDVSADPLILQAPPAVYEGDSLSLRCHSQPAYREKKLVFYKDNETIGPPVSGSELQIGRVNVTASGTYRCGKEITRYVFSPVTPYTAHRNISVQELFSPPHINVSPYDLIEGDHMTITCDTELRPHRETTELQFAFYRNGHNVQGFSLSNQYGVPSAQLEDSGNYTCEVQTPTGSVRKRSSVVTIHIQGAAARPVLSVSPNWAPILTGDSVNLTCNGARPAQGNESYTWYRGNSQRTGVERQTYVIHRARREQSGRYQCQIDAGDRSAAFQLTVSDEKLILQAPPGVHEGDELILRCHHPPDYRTSDTTFEFREEPINRSLGSDSVLPLGKAQANMSGPYRCKTKLYDKFHDITHNYTSPVEHLSVTELFSPPQIKVRPDQVTEGDHMTITCDTELRPHRETTELQIAFYRNGHNVQGFNSSNQYGVPSAQLEDSGKYTCEVQTPTGSVRKRSSMVHIHIQALLTKPQIILSSKPLAEGDEMTITCDPNLGNIRNSTELQFAFFKNGLIVQGFNDSSNYTVPSAQLEESGNYTCEVKKRSSVSQIQVEELFSTPQIKVRPDQVTQGDHMTITCDTKLRPHRETTELQFAFYRNGHNVQGFSLSNQYGVPSAQLEDSGNYTCEVQTPTGSVRKRSKVSHIEIQGAVESQDGGTTDSPPYLNKSKKEAASGDAKSAKRIPTQTNETMGDPGASHEGRTNATGVSSQMRETKEDTEQPGASLPSRGKETSSQLHFQLGERSQMYLALGLIGSVLALLVVAAAFVIKTRQKRSSWLIQHLQRLKTVHSRIPKVKMSSTPILVSFVPEEPRYTELPSRKSLIGSKPRQIILQNMNIIEKFNPFATEPPTSFLGSLEKQLSEALSNLLENG
uniref:Ig-like domain-containing protein n=1 Tax=Xenopus tropicalis TaxID=8364 RepID=A0A803JVD6_XENTR